MSPPNTSDGLRRVFIYKDGRDLILPYTILVDEPWPSGEIVGQAQTLWSARRKARRERLRANPPGKHLVETLP